MAFSFEIRHRSKKSSARTGVISTPHGDIHTPNFVPVATNATLKAVDNMMLSQQQAELVFCNTYHLALHPGRDVIEKAGGLHRFASRNAPIITDSGGFQVFSLAYGSVANELKSKGTKQTGNTVCKITEEGVTFRSYRDGALFRLTPESSVQIQKQLGADIIIPLDELPPFHCDPSALMHSFKRTHRWQMRSLRTHQANTKQQAMYAVVHGGVDKDLRQESCRLLSEASFDGFAVGGSLGRNTDDLDQVLSCCQGHLPEEKPRHLLGIADLAGIDVGIVHGMDTFDSCYPCRIARHGALITKQGKLKITATRYKEDFTPIEPDCSCWCCKHYSKAYLHHLFKAKEPTALTLATLHNTQAMFDAFKRIRVAIEKDQL